MLDFLSNSCLSLSYFICINRVNVTACQENAGVLFYAAQFIALGTLGLAFLGSRTATIQLLEIAKALQLRVLVDVNWREVFWRDQAASTDTARIIILAFLRKHAEFVKISKGTPLTFHLRVCPQACCFLCLLTDACICSYM
jgi:hypothetical protein